jgi:hypothetical protein
VQALEARLAKLLAEEDVEHLAAAVEPGRIAGVLIWENLWAAPFASAARLICEESDRRRARRSVQMFGAFGLRRFPTPFSTASGSLAVASGSRRRTLSRLNDA